MTAEMAQGSGRMARLATGLGRVAGSAAATTLTLLAICVVTFGLMHLTPGGPLSALGGAHGKATPEQVRELTRRAMLDEPVYVQFGAWLEAIAGGDFGYSTVSGAPVSALLWARALPSLELFVAVSLVAITLAWVLGLLMARREGGALDRTLLSATGVAQGIPAFWIGLLAIYLLVRTASPSGPLLPIAGSSDYLSAAPGLADRLRHLVLPSLVGAMVFLPYYIRVVRGLAVAALQEDYVQLARAKGIPELRVVSLHVGKNVVGPMLGLFGADLPAILTGLVSVEVVFSWPGLGQLLASAAASHDYPVVLAITLLGGMLTVAFMRTSRALANRVSAGRRTVLMNAGSSVW